jgi:hypothetical protein
MDWYLARSNVEAQQNPAYDPPSSKTNLWEPVPGDAGAHGDFDAEASPRSPFTALARHRAAVATAGAAAAGAVLTGIIARRRR